MICEHDLVDVEVRERGSDVLQHRSHCPPPGPTLDPLVDRAVLVEPVFRWGACWWETERSPRHKWNVLHKYRGFQIRSVDYRFSRQVLTKQQQPLGRNQKGRGQMGRGSTRLPICLRAAGFCGTNPFQISQRPGTKHSWFNPQTWEAGWYGI